MSEQNRLNELIERALALLPELGRVEWAETHAAAWRADRWLGRLVALGKTDDRLHLADLLHVDDQKAALVQNTRQFLAGLPANNVLLWGARGTGKSSLIQALLTDFADQGLRIVEVDKQDLRALAEIAQDLAGEPYRFVLFCDDLSFDAEDGDYKSLKSALEGSIFKVAQNVLIYATSNRRHLLPEYMSDNQATRVHENELHEGEAVEEKISLSDRFGLWLSFYPFKQDAYLDVVSHWIQTLAARTGLSVDIEDPELRAAALRWALARGVRNGRSAIYFARHWVGQQGLLESDQSNHTLNSKG